MMCTICSEAEAGVDGKCWNCAVLAGFEEKHELWQTLADLQNEAVLRQRWLDSLPDGHPCDEPGCLSHVSHPCESCGRLAGNRVDGLKWHLTDSMRGRQEMWVNFVDVGIALGVSPVNLAHARVVRKTAEKLVSDNGRMRTALQQILQSDYETAVSIAHAALVDSDG